MHENQGLYIEAFILFMREAKWTILDSDRDEEPKQ